jgi:DNA polymerase-1
MKYEIVGGTGNSPTVAILVPKIQTSEVYKHYYLGHLSDLSQDVMVCDLYISQLKKKTPATEMKEYLDDLVPHLINEGITMLVVTQPDYFKTLTKQAKTDATIGDVLPTVVKGLFATYCPNYKRIFYDPEKMKPRIQRALAAAVNWQNGITDVVGADIIHFEAYPKTNEDIIDWIDKLEAMDCDLTSDIEAFSLKHYDAGIGTITFCWNKHEGIAFPVDYVTMSNPNDPSQHGEGIVNDEVRARLRQFFINHQKRMIWHNISYDVYVLVYQLFMDDILDQEGMLYGLDIMLHKWECSQLISYLATNSCAGNELGLKIQAQEFAGNYAVSDIHDITKIPLDELLKYNLIDGLATWFVMEKNYPIAKADLQLPLYNDIFKPAIHDIIQMQLTGMPINMDKVKALNVMLTGESNALMRRMKSLDLVESFMDTLVDELLVEKNLKLKTKVFTKADMGSTKDTTIEFNPNSPKQLQRLLYSEDFLGLPVLDYTDTKLPATGAETLDKLLSHTSDPELLEFLELLIEFKASAIILSTFLPAFLQAHKGKDGWHYLFGNFRLGGTASGRLSSNNPNLQNIPSSGSSPLKSRLAKLIKECFEAPPGWLFVGLDFDSLEDKISAVTTKDPEKIKVYSDGYDGHCLRALAYFGDQMPDIELCPEDAQAYVATIDGEEVYFHSAEVIDYMGKQITGQELNDLINQG